MQRRRLRNVKGSDLGEEMELVRAYGILTNERLGKIG